MDNLKKQAEKILVKGKELNDPDLIRMAIEILETYEPEVKNITKSKKQIKSKNITKSNRAKPIGDITDQFRVNRHNKENKLGQKKSWENKFVDDGLEFANLKGETPPSHPKPKRKVRKQNVTCRVCGKKEKVLASLIMSESEGYRCNQCILQGRFD